MSEWFLSRHDHFAREELTYDNTADSMRVGLAKVKVGVMKVSSYFVRTSIYLCLAPSFDANTRLIGGRAVHA